MGLLRGINVGGRHSLPMARCQTVIEAAGGTNVVTYIQSGNVVFDHETGAGDHMAEAALAADLAEALADAAGFVVPVVLRNAQAWAALAERRPFDDPDPTKVHVGFLPARPDQVMLDSLGAIDEAAFGPDRFVVDGREIFLHLPEGIGRSKLAVRVSRAAPDATVRNWRTVDKLAELATGR